MHQQTTVRDFGLGRDLRTGSDDEAAAMGVFLETSAVRESLLLENVLKLPPARAGVHRFNSAKISHRPTRRGVDYQHAFG